MRFRAQAIAFSVAATLLLGTPLPYMSDGTTLGVSSAFAGNGNGKAKGNENSGNKGKSTGQRSKSQGASEKVGGNGNEHAKVAGLNSLKRNINGLMNSSDPRMEGIRAFVTAGAELAVAEANLETAQATLTTSQTNYNELVAGFGLVAYDGDTAAYADTSLSALEGRRDALVEILAGEPDNAEANTEYEALLTAIDAINASAELSALIAAEGEVELYTSEVAAGEAATSDEALTAALLVAANDNRVGQYGDTYVDATMLAWAREQLGMTQ